jgi:hypothetical protein
MFRSVAVENVRGLDACSRASSGQSMIVDLVVMRASTQLCDALSNAAYPDVSGTNTELVGEDTLRRRIKNSVFGSR